jgi:hemerythrin-like domain-containing protein
MEADSSKQVQLKAYANKYLPKIKMHLQKADSISLSLMD